jgi:hypothetical protein
LPLLCCCCILAVLRLQLVDCTYHSGVSSSCTRYYTVKPNDNCWRIWTENALSESTFRALNPGINCNNLQIGTTLCVESLAGSNCVNTYVVQPSDNCWRIWTSNGLTEARFRELNPGINCNNLQIGTPVCLDRSGCSLGYMVRPTPAGAATAAATVAAQPRHSHLVLSEHGVRCSTRLGL